MTEHAAPSVVIELGVESAPRVRVFCMNESEERRLMDWIFHQDDLADLIQRALEIAEDQPAA